MDADMTYIDWLMMLHSCMSREVPLVGYTNISIDDEQYYGSIKGYLCSCLICIKIEQTQ
jgi:hypothetical protein